MPEPDNLPAPPSRLLDLQQAAQYLSVSPWTVRDLERAGSSRECAFPSATAGNFASFFLTVWISTASSKTGSVQRQLRTTAP
jgi:hypothetical protein